MLNIRVLRIPVHLIGSFVIEWLKICNSFACFFVVGTKIEHDFSVNVRSWGTIDRLTLQVLDP
jgi:hypothetical protein